MENRIKKLTFIFISICLMFIAGCNGHTDNGNEKDPQVVGSITFSVLDDQGNPKQSFDKNETVTLQAVVLDEKNNIMANKAVAFSASIGSLTVSSKLTDSEGIARVTLTNDSLVIGAGTASAIIGEISSNVVDFEFIDSDTPELTPKIQTTMMLDGVLVNQFKADQKVQIISTLLDESNLPISNQVINFTADIGVLNTSTALTNEQGIANVSLTSTSDSIGAGVITSTYTIGNEESASISSSLNYQIIAADPIAGGSIVFSLLDDQGNPKQSFDKNETVTLQAVVLDENNNIIANKAVAFSTTIGSLTVSSKLTDSEGIARVTLTNETLTLGAGLANASVDEISSNAVDFEFIDSGTPDLIPKIQTTMMLDGVLVNQFKADQKVQIISTLLDESNLPISNQIINFTADIGVLNTSTALTNEQGIANVSLTSTTDSIGAGVITSSYNIDSKDSTSISSSLNYQILAADAIIDSDIRLGYFDAENNFVEGKIALSISETSISAGGTLGLSVNLVDESGKLIVTPIPVTFTSNCVQNSTATIDESVLSINGTASSTFEDISCAGTSGTDDVILASVAVNGITNTASETITINGEELGSIEFISAEPTSIVLKGTGGQDKQETSTLTFKVKSQLGNVLAQQEVNFVLSTAVGGISLSRASGFTNSQGLITTQVSAGNVPTAVRVTASAEMSFNSEVIKVQSQSDLLSINTGLPEQRSMTIAASILNPEANSFSGEVSQITVWLSDNFHNPVPDGTTVNFTTEGGHIEPTCSTVNGSCFVSWESANPRVDNHRVTILATALGHETFFDTNGNNIFDDADGDPIKDIGNANDFNIDSGLGNYPAQASGFLDMSEAWRDDNENSVYDVGEKFIDFNNDNVFSEADSLFNGPQCQGANCAATNMQAIHVRKAVRLVMASSAAEFILTNGDSSIVYQNTLTGENNDLGSILDGASQEFIFSFADTGTPNQTMPMGTTVSIEASAGELLGQTSFIVGNNNNEGFSTMNFFIVNTAEGEPETSILTITITTPKNFVSGLTRSISLL